MKKGKGGGNRNERNNLNPAKRNVVSEEKWSKFRKGRRREKLGNQAHLEAHLVPKEGEATNHLGEEGRGEDPVLKKRGLVYYKRKRKGSH